MALISELQGMGWGPKCKENVGVSRTTGTAWWCHTRAANFMCFGAQWWLGN